jgi:hypothetical protein
MKVFMALVFVGLQPWDDDLSRPVTGKRVDQDERQKTRDEWYEKVYGRGRGV